MKTVAIVGGGVDGLGIARQIGLDFPDTEIVLFERNRTLGSELSEHNSGVIHAGLYYTPGSFKDMFCAIGNKLLKEYCAQRGVPVANTGKYIVATDGSQVFTLEQLALTAKRHDIPVEFLTEEQVYNGSEQRDAFPQVRCFSALYVKSTALIDQGALIRALAEDFEYSNPDKTRVALTRATVTAIEGSGPYTVHFTEQNGQDTFAADVIINAAGVNATRIASLAGFPHYSKDLNLVQGRYWTTLAFPNRTPVYPVPTEHSLGLHYTPVLGGAHALLGPSVRVLQSNNPEELPADAWITPDSEEEREIFHREVSRYLDGVSLDSLRPDMAGVRPQQLGPKAKRDFVMVDEHASGKPGFINCLFNESPGLTSVLPRAQYVSSLARRYLE